ncbi:MAG: T9SS type A sorting domain-containing protein, partial [Acidobacteriota bacterium]
MKKEFSTVITKAMKAPFMLLAIMAASLCAQVPVNLPGTIAYFRVVGTTQTDPGISELHLIDPNGTNDRIIFRTPRGLTTIYPVPLWRPDGREIAFASAHEKECSAFDSDVYAIQPDGSGLRRITNAPMGEELARLPKGSVTVTVENLISNASIFFVYVEGATNLKQVLIAPGASATVTVGNVAELGRLQYVFVKGGLGTWIFPQAYADVIPGQTVAASNPVQITSGYGPFNYKINYFTWKSDGSEIAYLVEAGALEFLPAHPANGQRGQNLFTGNTGLVNGSLCWLPGGEEFLYYSILAAPEGIYCGAKGTDVATHPLVVATDFVSNISMLPDGSGFLYAIQHFGYAANEIVKFDFASKQTTVLVGGSLHLSGVAVSPDGHYIAFADRADANVPFDLYGMAIEGSQQWKIAEDVVSWDWGTESPTAVEGASKPFVLVKDFSLLPNYPNPFNPSTTIRYVLPAAAYVTLKIFDVLGREIAAPVNAHQGAGSHTVTFDPQLYKHGSASGVYLYRLTAHAEG